MKWAVPHIWATYNNTFNTDKLGDIEIFCVEYSASKKVHLQLDMAQINLGRQLPMYDLINSKHTLHNLGVCVCVCVMLSMDQSRWFAILRTV